jgi:hypothetical protein
MTADLERPAARPNMPCVTAELGKLRQSIKRVMQGGNIDLGAGKAPLPKRMQGDLLDIGDSRTRKRVATQP